MLDTSVNAAEQETSHFLKTNDMLVMTEVVFAMLSVTSIQLVPYLTKMVSG